jgi:hypothetical protein
MLIPAVFQYGATFKVTAKKEACKCFSLFSSKRKEKGKAAY